MRSLSAVLCSVVAAALLAGCSGTTSQITPSGWSTGGSSTAAQTRSRHSHNQKPQWAYPANLFDNKSGAGPRFREVLSALTKPRTSQPDRGIYVNQFYGDEVLAFQNNNTSNNAAFCSVFTGESSAVNGVAVDRKGNLIIPIGATYSGLHVVTVWKGPGMCGTTELGSVNDSFGQASNAASLNAATGKIVVVNIFDTNNTAGSLAICTLASGCTSHLTNAAMYKVAGVALDTHGNCWASAEDQSGAATLTYFAGCTGGGEEATGFMNTDYGDLMFDRSGNLVSIDKTGEQVWVYSGCNPACTLVGGPFPLLGEAVAGALNHQAMTLAVGDRTSGAVDVYYYSPTGLTYYYSFNNGLSVSATIEGIAFNPTVRPSSSEP